MGNGVGSAPGIRTPIFRFKGGGPELLDERGQGQQDLHPHWRGWSSLGFCYLMPLLLFLDLAPPQLLVRGSPGLGRRVTDRTVLVTASSRLRVLPAEVLHLARLDSHQDKLFNRQPCCFDTTGHDADRTCTGNLRLERTTIF